MWDKLITYFIPQIYMWDPELCLKISKIHFVAFIENNITNSDPHLQEKLEVLLYISPQKKKAN